MTNQLGSDWYGAWYGWGAKGSYRWKWHDFEGELMCFQMDTQWWLCGQGKHGGLSNIDPSTSCYSNTVICSDIVSMARNVVFNFLGNFVHSYVWSVDFLWLGLHLMTYWCLKLLCRCLNLLCRCLNLLCRCLNLLCRCLNLLCRCPV